MTDVPVNLIGMICPGKGPKGRKLTWQTFWTAIAQLQVEAVLQGRACPVSAKP